MPRNPTDLLNLINAADRWRQRFELSEENVKDLMSKLLAAQSDLLNATAKCSALEQALDYCLKKYLTVIGPEARRSIDWKRVLIDLAAAESTERFLRTRLRETEQALEAYRAIHGSLPR